jgi:hypothetical protein
MSMRKSSWSLWIIFFCVVNLLFGQNKKWVVPNSTYYSREELTQDLDTLIACLERYHPSLYAFQTSQQWENHKKQTQISLKDSMTALDVYSNYSALIHKIHCGHTMIYPSQNLSMWYPHYFKELPLKLHLLNDTIYVYDGEKTNIPKGSVIHKIGAYTSSQMIKKLDTIILNRDGNREDIFNFMFSDNMFSTFFAESDKQNYLIGYQNYQTKKYQQDTLTMRYFFTNKKKEKVEDYFSYQKLENNVAVLKIKTFQNDHIKELEPFMIRLFCEGLKSRIKSTFRQTRRDDIEHLIIDIRENEGGDPYLAYQICSYVLEQQFQYFEYFLTNKKTSPNLYSKNMLHLDSVNTRYFYDKNNAYSYTKRDPNQMYKNQLYVLIDDGTYSTGVQLAALLKYHNRATIIGQKTSGIANYCNAYQFIQYTLPNTKTYGIIPVFKVPLAIKLSDKEGVNPDYNIKSTISEVVQNKDIELNFTLKLIEQKNYKHSHKLK